MSIQDSIYDVRAALEGKQEQELFDEIVDYLFNLEQTEINLREEIRPWRQIKTSITQEVLNSIVKKSE